MPLTTPLQVASDSGGKGIFVLGDYTTHLTLTHFRSSIFSIVPPMILYDESAAPVVGITILPHPAITKKTIAHEILRSRLDIIYYTNNPSQARFLPTQSALPEFGNATTSFTDPDRGDSTAQSSVVSILFQRKNIHRCCTSSTSRP
jgi:hypothetical protein